MRDAESSDPLANRVPDYVVTAAKAALGAVPLAGSLLAELAGSIIPNQRIERIVAFRFGSGIGSDAATESLRPASGRANRAEGDEAFRRI